MRFFQHRIALLPACLPLAFAISACTQPAPSTPPPAAPAAAPTQTPAERGKVLVQVGGCHDCHTTKKDGEPDMSVMLSGHPASIKLPSAPKPAAGSPWIIQTTGTLTAPRPIAAGETWSTDTDGLDLPTLTVEFA